MSGNYFLAMFLMDCSRATSQFVNKLLVVFLQKKCCHSFLTIFSHTTIKSRQIFQNRMSCKKTLYSDKQKNLHIEVQWCACQMHHDFLQLLNYNAFSKILLNGRSRAKIMTLLLMSEVTRSMFVTHFFNSAKPTLHYGNCTKH